MNTILDGQWAVGYERNYDKTATIPGLLTDPRETTTDTIWLKRAVERPTTARIATLLLKGARFAPEIYVDGALQSSSEGGMGWIRHRLDLDGTDNTFTLEIALKSLDEIPATDASKIPDADRWRSNISSCLWDDVEIRFHGDAAITQLYTFTDDDGRVHVRTGTEGTATALRFSLVDAEGELVLEHESAHAQDIALPGSEELPLWSPETPNCFTLSAELLVDDKVSDQDSVTVARRRFTIDGKRFRLNDKPVTVCAGSIVWHRWVRDPEARELGWDLGWITENVLLRLKRLGANTLRFHLGMPPDAVLDACDRLGLMVQAEWSFFHGLDASEESLIEQWGVWFEQCFRHPSICIVHPWNETDPKVLDGAWSALNKLTDEFPPLVLSHRDVIHPHRYWWSLFENVGLYYDSADAFDKPIMADEFGGNYLDGDGNPGRYPSVRESYARFLGRNHTVAERLQLHADANARMAEYWRRIGAAGFSPFCILGSPEDGNHHFRGALRDGRPKPVWDALRAAYAPVSASIDLWDRNFLPGQTICPEMHLFNETAAAVDATLRYGIEGTDQQKRPIHLQPFTHESIPVSIVLPDQAGEWTVETVLEHSERTTALPSRSRWRIWTITPDRTGAEVGATFPDEPELSAFLGSVSSPNVWIGGQQTYGRMIRDKAFREEIEAILRSGKHVILLNAGPQYFGRNYSGEARTEQLGNKASDEVYTHLLPLDLGVAFRYMPEPESVIHPAEGMEKLWTGLVKENTAIWCGMKGGIIVPAVDMSISGFSQDAMLATWAERGADADAIRSGPYYAYEKGGYVYFAHEKREAEEQKLNDRIDFLVADAPALAGSINRNAPATIRNLHDEWTNADGKARSMRPLIICGKGLTRTAAYAVDFEDGCGQLILSQLLTDGRLAEGFSTGTGARPDPGAQQLVYNLIRSLG